MLAKLVLLAAACAVGVAAACKSNTISSTMSDTMGVDVIGPSGGTVALDDGTEVRIPAGALTADTTISVSVAQPGEYPPQTARYTWLGKVYAFEPHGLKLQTPAVIDVAYGGPSSDLVVLRADPNGRWSEMTGATFTATIGEVAATSFSFYTVASTTGAPDVGATCSGRGPNYSAPHATSIAGMSGQVPPGSGSGSAVDLATMVDGYALQGSFQYGATKCDSGTAYSLSIVLTSYPDACGYAANGVQKIGGDYVVVSVVSPWPLTTRNYVTAEVNAGSARVPATTEAGACGGGGSSFASTSECPTGATALTITALDANHVAGTFDFTPVAATAPIHGSFDVPLCAVVADLEPPLCCL